MTDKDTAAAITPSMNVATAGPEDERDPLDEVLRGDEETPRERD